MKKRFIDSCIERELYCKRAEIKKINAKRKVVEWVF